MTTRILVIDDDELVRATLTRILLAADFEVLEATDGKNGLQKYQEGNIDLVITDILMPVMEGVETIRELRRVDADAKIIAISGGDRTGNMNYLELAGKLGADGILAKPILRQDLMTKIEAILGT
ncbi:MAG: response regulator [Rhodospirillaceae bacterium]|jgi:CheY-like chemotaxis protein|nr:response regulator [Rhodospirillaceae bacterium]MBT4043030.1 response regulator [Rhodospirillaceae bacterium]MBT4687080.1 response regulator [Rhodospirillaceae bacterium]MBT5082596.1 response regulator [Rhodospirillaceae bacterium]MBT5526074.1 response regulator [Rhodospirillaceae bacterium]